MEDIFSVGWDELLARETGALHFRCIFQPLMATFFGVRSGLKDARAGNPAFVETFVADAGQRQSLLLQLWKDIGKLYLVAVALDVIYQLAVLRWFYPVQALIVAFALAILPYLISRGVTNRVGSRMGLRNPPS